MSIKFENKLQRGTGKWRQKTCAVDFSEIWTRDDMPDGRVCHFVAESEDGDRAEYLRLKCGEFGCVDRLPKGASYWLVSSNGALATTKISDAAVDKIFAEDEPDGEIDLATAKPDGEA